MASYYFSVKSNNKGYAVQHYIYVTQLKKYEKILQSSHEILEYVEHGQCMPDWVNNPIEFWQAADRYERANAKVHMEYEMVLPKEFTVQQRKILVATFAQKYLASLNYPYSYALHNVRNDNSEHSPHCHLMFSLKANDGLPRHAEQYFKRYNPKAPALGGVKKIQLHDGHEDYATFLLYIRKAWENHLNDALSQYCPTVCYEINGETFTINNQVSADSYEKYNEKYGTLYLPEPKLSRSRPKATPSFLLELQKIRLHNNKERELEYKQHTLQQQYEYLYNCSDEAFSSLEVVYYVSYMLKTATNLEQLAPDLKNILRIYQPIFKLEHCNVKRMNAQLHTSHSNPSPCFEFQLLEKPVVSESI